MLLGFAGGAFKLPQASSLKTKRFEAKCFLSEAGNHFQGQLKVSVLFLNGNPWFWVIREK